MPAFELGKERFTHLFGIAKDERTVILVVEQIIDARVTRLQAPLDDKDMSGF